VPPWLTHRQTDFDRLYYYKSLSVAAMILPPWLTHRQTDFNRLYYYKSLSVAVMICGTVVNTQTDKF